LNFGKVVESDLLDLAHFGAGNTLDFKRSVYKLCMKWFLSKGIGYILVADESLFLCV
jgi:hypothetical protein